MSDLERLLKDSLRSVGEGFHPRDPLAARERFLRRRRRRTIGLVAGGTALAGAAAAVAAIAFWSVGTAPERDVPVASTSTDAVVSARIDVGNGAEPSGVGSGAGYVWVANSGSGTVSKVDPTTNEVEQEITMDFAGTPDDVVVRTGWVWVVSDAGELARIEPDRGVVEPVATVGDGGHLDIAPGTGEDLWLLETGGDAYQIDGATGEQLMHLTGGDDVTDVSTSDGTVWIYDRGTGEVVSYDAEGRELDRIAVGISKYADLSAGEGYTWFYRGSDGTLLQIEQGSASVLKEYELGGTFGAISIGPDAVYALVVDGGPGGTGRGELFRFDADHSTKLGKTVPLADLPFDVDWGQDAIWITNNSGDTLTRIDLVPKGTTPSPDPTPEVAAPAEVLFYYAAGGDIYAYDENGGSEPVADTKELETSPTVAPDGKALVFQRGEGPEAEIVYLPLREEGAYSPAREETVISDGEAPSFGPDGRLAWATLPKNGPAITHVSVGTIGTDDRIDIPVDSGLGPFTIHRIEWTSDAGSLFFHASYEGDTIFRADIPPPGGDASEVVLEEVVPIEEGAAFVSPALDGADALHLIRLCCGTYPEWGDLTTADLGVVRNGVFEKTLGLDDLGWEPTFDIVASWAGGLDYESTAGWSVADKQTWFVSNQEELWLIDAETREMDNLELSGVVSVEPVPGSGPD